MKISVQRKEISLLEASKGAGLEVLGQLGGGETWVRGTEKVVEKCKEFSAISKRNYTQEREGASL